MDLRVQLIAGVENTNYSGVFEFSFVIFLNIGVITAYFHSFGMQFSLYTGCPKRKGPNFGRVFLRSNYNDITQNTYVQSSMVTEILAREV